MEYLKDCGGSAEDQKLIFLLIKAGVKSQNLKRCFDALEIGGYNPEDRSLILRLLINGIKTIDLKNCF